MIIEVDQKGKKVTKDKEKETVTLEDYVKQIKPTVRKDIDKKVKEIETKAL